MKIFQVSFIYLIRLARFFKHQLYPVLYSTFGFVSVCHHQPSCSEYAIQQIRTHGTIRGLYKGLIRLSQCY